MDAFEMKVCIYRSDTLDHLHHLNWISCCLQLNVPICAELITGISFRKSFGSDTEDLFSLILHMHETKEKLNQRFMSFLRILRVNATVDTSQSR